MNKLKLPSYGGQALIEGVLMRGEYAIAASMDCNVSMHWATASPEAHWC